MRLDRWVRCGACQRTSVSGPGNRCPFCGRTGQLSDVPPPVLSVKSVDLSDVNVSPAVTEALPESVARENVLMPIAEEGSVLVIATADPLDYETLEKVQFILAREIQPVLAPAEQIVAAINRHYGHP